MEVRSSHRKSTPSMRSHEERQGEEVSAADHLDHTKVSEARSPFPPCLRVRILFRELRELLPSPNRKTYLLAGIGGADRDRRRRKRPLLPAAEQSEGPQARFGKVHPKKTGRGPGRRDNLQTAPTEDRKSTRLNSSHQIISYAVFCLKKNNI